MRSIIKNLHRTRAIECEAVLKKIDGGLYIMRKKAFVGLFLTVAFLTLLLLSGCGAAKPEENTDNKVITMLTAATPSDSFYYGFQKIIDDFNATNEYGVTIQCDFVSTPDFKTKLPTLMSSGSEPDIIYTLELGYLGVYVDAGKIVNLQPYYDADPAWHNSFNDGMLEQLTYNGDVYGVPTQQTMALMFYNKAIFAENGVEVPTTYDEFLGVCEKLKSNGVTPIALASTPADAWLVSQYIQQLSDGLGGYELFSGIADGTRSWNDPAMVKAGMLFQEEISKGYYENGFTGVSGEEAEAIFQRGDAAMYFNGTWETGTLASTEFTAIADDVGCFIFPAVDSQYKNVGVGSCDYCYAITENCKNVDAAVAFLKYWTSEAAASMLLYDYSCLPATRFDIDDTRLSPLAANVLECYAEAAGVTPWYDRVDADLGNEFNNISVSISNGEDPQAMFNSLQSYAEGK